MQQGMDMKLSLPGFFLLAQVCIITEPAGLVRRCEIEPFRTDRRDDRRGSFCKCPDGLFGREIINHLVIFDVVEGCTLRQPAKQISDSEGVEVELDITED